MTTPTSAVDDGTIFYKATVPGVWRNASRLDDGFPDLDGFPSPPLYQASDEQPDYYDPLGVNTNYFGFGPSYAGHQDTYVRDQGVLSGYDFTDINDMHVGQGAVWVELDRDDNVEVGVLWNIVDYFSFSHQVAPVGCVDVNADDPEQCGLLVNGDQGLYDLFSGHVFYLQNMFRVLLENDEGGSDMLNPAPYNTYPATGTVYPGGMGALYGTQTWLRMRFVDGYMQGLVNNTEIGAPVARPSWSDGRDAWGLRILTIWSPTGSLFNDMENGGTPTVADHESPAQVVQWYARPYETALV